MPSFTAARLIAVARRTVPWLVGPAVLALRGGVLELANPSACPGLLELASIAALRARPDLHIGAVFELLQLIVMTAALAAFVELLGRRTRSVAVAVVAAGAIGLGPQCGYREPGIPRGLLKRHRFVVVCHTVFQIKSCRCAPRNATCQVFAFFSR